MENPLRMDIQEYYACWREMNDLYGRWAAKFHLSLYSLYVLYELFESGEECTQKRICERWYLPKQTVSSILKNLERDGYLYFKTMEKDKRNKCILLTPKGREYTDRIIGSLTKLEEKVMIRMGVKKRRAMNEGSRLFCTYFSQELAGEKNE